MTANRPSIRAPFERAWPGSNIGDYRRIRSTYLGFDYDALPSIVVPRDPQFSWIPPVDDVIARQMGPHWRDAEGRSGEGLWTTGERA
jgi:hypothetical protein